MTVPAEEDIDRFEAVIMARMGLRSTSCDRRRLSELLEARCRDARCSAGDYLDRLALSQGNQEELRTLASELTVAETYFFRHPEHFQAFVEVAVAQRVKAKSTGRRLRILSAGCASGEEAYTLAILLREWLAGMPEQSWNVEILGIDINPTQLEKAARGRYSEWSLRCVPQDRRDRSFRKEGQVFVLDESVREMVHFEERNLVVADPGFWQPGRFDIIFFRNVLIYLSLEASRTVIGQISQSLVPGGFLFLGPPENLRGVSRDFHLRHSHDCFYYERLPLPTHPISGARSGSGLAADSGTLSKGTPSSEEHPSPVELNPGAAWFETISEASGRIAALSRGVAGTPRPVAAAGSPGTAASPSIANLGAARELLRQERFEEAMVSLAVLPPEQALDLDAQLLRAVILTNSGREAEAERVCRDILAHDEMNAGAHYLIALCLEHTGDHRGAAEHDQTAIYLSPTFAMPHFHLGRLARREGNMATARRWLMTAQKLLTQEEASCVLLYGGGFTRESLVGLCQAELRACAGATGAREVQELDHEH